MSFAHDLAAALTDSPFERFQARYRHDPVAFIHDCVRWRDDERPTAYQDEIIADLHTYGRETVRGPHGLGKTMLAALAIHHFALTRDGDDWKVPITASAWRQLTHFLFPELHKWARRLRWDIIGRPPYDPRTELLRQSLKLRTGEAFAVASSDPALIEGAHADHLLYVFDEAKAIPAELFDAAEGAFSGAGGETTREAFALAISTPGEPQGRFYDLHARKPGFEDWHTRHVTLAEAMAAGRISAEWAEQRARQWGVTSAVYINRVAGEFAASDEDGLIPLAWVEAANERWAAWKDAGSQRGALTCVGVDVSDAGGDRTVLALRHDDVIAELRFSSKEETMATTGRVAGVLTAHERAYAVVDVIGIGAGVVSRLREMFPKTGRIEAFNASERSDAKDRSGELGFANKRAAAWWNLRELLDPAAGATIALPPDDTLTGDLTAAHWRVQSGGKILIESKDEIRGRIGRSTDAGDAVVQAFAPIPKPVGRPFEAVAGPPRPTFTIRQ